MHKGDRAIGGDDVRSAVRLGDERHQLDVIIGDDLGAGGGNGEFVAAFFGRKAVERSDIIGRNADHGGAKCGEAVGRFGEFMRLGGAAGGVGGGEKVQDDGAFLQRCGQAEGHRRAGKAGLRAEIGRRSADRQRGKGGRAHAKRQESGRNQRENAHFGSFARQIQWGGVAVRGHESGVSREKMASDGPMMGQKHDQDCAFMARKASGCDIMGVHVRSATAAAAVGRCWRCGLRAGAGVKPGSFPLAGREWRYFPGSFCWKPTNSL